MPVLLRLLAVGLCAAAAACAVHAQSTAAAASGRPVVRSLPNPAGLQPVFPAGITTGSGANVATTRVARSNSPLPQPTTTIGTTTTTGIVVLPQSVPSEVVVPVTTAMGAGATVAGPSQYLTASGAGGVSAVDEARSFFFADANHDGELTPAEFRRLSIVTQTFEQMDRNFDGLVSRWEYDDSLR